MGVGYSIAYVFEVMHELRDTAVDASETFPENYPPGRHGQPLVGDGRKVDRQGIFAPSNGLGPTARTMVSILYQWSPSNGVGWPIVVGLLKKEAR